MHYVKEFFENPFEYVGYAFMAIVAVGLVIRFGRDFLRDILSD